MKHWVWRWLARRQEEEDLADEIRSHLAIEERQQLESGEGPDTAAPAARQAFGNVLRIQEDVRETWGWAGAERFREDVRFGLRMLRKTPVWTTIICATLALGIGLSTAIFSESTAFSSIPCLIPKRTGSLLYGRPPKVAAHVSASVQPYGSIGGKTRPLSRTLRSPDRSRTSI